MFACFYPADFQQDPPILGVLHFELPRRCVAGIGYANTLPESEVLRRQAGAAQQQ